MYCEQNITRVINRESVMATNPVVTLNPEQLKALESMRQQFLSTPIDSCGLALTDATFLRYLRARNYDVTKSSLMLRATIKWRHDFGLKDMSPWSETLQLEATTGKMYIRGFDKDGHILLYMRPGNENTKNHDGNMKHTVYILERAIAIMESITGQQKLMMIIDYDGFSMSKAPPFKTSKEVLDTLQNHYPERLYRAYCINAPWFMNAFWTAIWPFIDAVTKLKIQLVKGEAATSALLSVIDSKVLEKQFGGDDSRPFDSEAFLKGPYNWDYLMILNNNSPTSDLPTSVGPAGSSTKTIVEG